MIPKQDFGHRMILNLKFFNCYLTFVHFKMQTLNHILSNITPACYMSVFDFCDAYLTCPISPDHVKFLCFRFQGKTFMYVVLPFGISLAPRKFTKVLVPILSLLRHQAIVIITYLDDGFTCALTYDFCKYNICHIMTSFSHFGFIINKKKSAPVPSQHVRSLGFHLNSVAMMISLPQDKIERALYLCNTVISQQGNIFTIQFLAQLIGTLISLFLACPVGQLHYRT